MYVLVWLPYVTEIRIVYICFVIYTLNFLFRMTLYLVLIHVCTNSYTHIFVYFAMLIIDFVNFSHKNLLHPLISFTFFLQHLLLSISTTKDLNS